MKKIVIKNWTVLTLFPEFVESYANFGIIKRAIKKKLIKISALNIRDFGLDKRGTVDDRPFGGGVGMVLRADVVYKAIKGARSRIKNRKSRVVLLTPQGKPFVQKDATRLSKYDSVILVSGRYEGFDERIRKFVDEEVSIGDYVLMGGELPALVIMEAALRLVPGVLGKDESADKESFSDGMLEYPQYTKPETWEVTVGTRDKGLGTRKKIKLKVPAVLRTGHHANIEKWRKEEALKRTKKRRPDLLPNLHGREKMEI